MKLTKHEKIKKSLTMLLHCHKKIHKENNLWDISKTKNRL